MKDTPRTDERKASFALDTIRQLETELAAARAEIERLDTAGIHSCHKDCQRPNCVLRRELKAVTEQRDRLAEALNRIANNNVQDLPETNYAYEFGRIEGIAKIALQSLTTNADVDAPAP